MSICSIKYPVINSKFRNVVLQNTKENYMVEIKLVFRNIMERAYVIVGL